MKGMVLAAGYGKRLRPETDIRPKPLFEIGSTNMLRNAIGFLYSAGIEHMAVNAHHLAGQIEKELQTDIPQNISINLIKEETIMGTAGGIKGAEPFIGNEEFVLINSDILIDVNLPALIEQHRKSAAVATMVIRDNPAPSRIGTLTVNQSGRLIRFLGSHIPAYQPEQVSGPPKMFTGLAIFSPEIFSHIPHGRPVDISSEVYPKIMELNRPIYTYNHTGYWADIGTPESYRAARMDVAVNRFTPYKL